MFPILSSIVYNIYTIFYIFAFIYFILKYYIHSYMFNSLIYFILLLSKVRKSFFIYCLIKMDFKRKICSYCINKLYLYYDRVYIMGFLKPFINKILYI